MLATAGPLPTGPGWAYEAKFDGMRALVYASGDQWRLLTRTGRDATGGFPELAVVPDLVRGRAVVLDGELVGLGSAGVPEFSLMQQRMMVRRPSAALLAAVPVQLYLFDLLHLDGADTLDLPYIRRRHLLESLHVDQAPMRTPPTFGEGGADLLAAVAATGLEGVVSKRLTSTYRPGRRSRDWIKTLVPHTTRR
jgi:bifunctional non-homologous end joining protein LigD